MRRTRSALPVRAQVVSWVLQGAAAFGIAALFALIIIELMAGCGIHPSNCIYIG